MYKAMNAGGFDAGTLGNHEFNYGLRLPQPGRSAAASTSRAWTRSKKCAGPNFPLVLANVQSVKSGKPLLAPTSSSTSSFTATAPDGYARDGADQGRRDRLHHAAAS